MQPGWPAGLIKIRSPASVTTVSRSLHASVGTQSSHALRDPSGVAGGRCAERHAMTKLVKGKMPKPANHNEVHQPLVGEAGPREANLKALAKSFAPMVETRAVEDLKVNPRNARMHSPRQVQQV